MCGFFLLMGVGISPIFSFAVFGAVVFLLLFRPSFYFYFSDTSTGLFRKTLTIRTLFCAISIENVAINDYILSPFFS